MGRTDHLGHHRARRFRAARHLVAERRDHTGRPARPADPPAAARHPHAPRRHRAGDPDHLPGKRQEGLRVVAFGLLLIVASLGFTMLALWLQRRQAAPAVAGPSRAGSATMTEGSTPRRTALPRPGG